MHEDALSCVISGDVSDVEKVPDDALMLPKDPLFIEDALKPMATTLNTSESADPVIEMQGHHFIFQKKMSIRVILPNGSEHVFEEPELSAKAALSVLRREYPQFFETGYWTFATPGLRRANEPYVLIPAHNEHISAEMVVHWRRIDAIVGNPNAPGGWVLRKFTKENEGCCFGGL